MNVCTFLWMLAIWPCTMRLISVLLKSYVNNKERENRKYLSKKNIWTIILPHCLKNISRRLPYKMALFVFVSESLLAMLSCFQYIVIHEDKDETLCILLTEMRHFVGKLLKVLDLFFWSSFIFAPVSRWTINVMLLLISCFFG